MIPEATRIRDLTDQELTHRLAHGLDLETGPFVFHIQSREVAVFNGIRRIYADFPISTEAVRDFHVRVRRPNNLRRWYHPQVVFEHDRESPFKPLPASHAFASLEWGMNWCIAGYAHHYLTLHAAVLERNGRAVMLPGEPGAGKSTLTAALSLSGWRLLTDETALVDLDTGELWPMARPINLKNNSIDIIQAFSRSAIFGDKAFDTHKGTVAHLKPSQDTVTRMHESSRIGWVIFPRWEADAQAKLTRRPRADTFVFAAENSFNYSVLGETGFRTLEGLIRHADCYDFRYGKLEDALLTFEKLSA
jgi:HprK-related kinase A